MISQIGRASPTLAELLRLCLLRAGLSTSPAAAPFVLGHPRAWLGTAYHEVVVASADGDGRAPDIESAWNIAIQRQYNRSLTHPLDHRWGPPERWPGYHLTRAMALMRGVVASQRAQPGPAGGGQTGQHTQIARERPFTSTNGKLVGRPDLVRGDLVLDYKTGHIYEPDDPDVLKAAYIRQLQLYAFLVKEETGNSPRRGVILPMEGPAVEIELDPTECDQLADEVFTLMERYNNAVQSEASVTDLANPSMQTCRLCPYQLICPAFWVEADETWSHEYRTAALEGIIVTPVIRIHDGAALALDVQVTAGTVADGKMHLAPLHAEVHAALKDAPEGTSVRIVGLSRREDGTLTTSKRTVTTRSDCVPAIVVRPSDRS